MTFRPKAVLALLAIVVLTAITATGIADPARAAGDATSGLSLPFVTGQNWFANGPHQNVDNAIHPRNSIDFSGGDGHVRAAAGGKVRIMACTGGLTLMIDHANDWHTTYYHLTNVQVSNGDAVSQGDWIGDIGTATPCGGSALGAHVHFGVWHFSGTFTGADSQAASLDNLSIGGWTLHQTATNYEGSWIRDLDAYTCVSTDNYCTVQNFGSPLAQVDGDGDGVADASDVCPTELGDTFLSGCPERVGVLSRGGVLQVKEGSLDSGWVTLQGEVKQFAMSNRRIGIVMSDGSAYVKDGGVGAGWVLVSGEVRQLALSGDRIAMLKNDGKVLVKQGSVSAGWVLVNGAGSQIALSGNRIGVLHTNGDLEVKEGSIDAGWILEQGEVSRFALTDDRVGAVLTSGVAQVKEGGLQGGWITLDGDVKDVQLSGDRVLVLHVDGTVAAKAGYIGNPWVLVDEASAMVATSPDRLGSVKTDGTARAKDGGIDAGWKTIQGDVAGICFNVDCATPAFVTSVLSVNPPSSTGLPQVATATNQDEAATNQNATVTHVAPAVIKNIAPPKITGAKKVGKKITAASGEWTVSGLKYKYQWLRNGKAIRGATGKTYKIVRANKGHKLSVRVTATKSGYASASSVSAQTSKIKR